MLHYAFHDAKTAKWNFFFLQIQHPKNIRYPFMWPVWSFALLENIYVYLFTEISVSSLAKVVSPCSEVILNLPTLTQLVRLGDIFRAQWLGREELWHL